MRLNPSERLSRLVSSYWFIPLMVTLGGVALAVSLLLLDERIRLERDDPLAVLRPTSAEGARALLSAVIGAMITAISVTFSVTIVALTVAAQHFGPRVLNNFVRQTSAQIVLGTFMATFVYAVLALGAIEGTGADANIPELTVSGVVVLVIASIGALIYYVHHVSTTLQIGELAGAIALDLKEAVPRDQGQAAPGDDELEIPEAPPDATLISSVESGYVQRIDYKAILAVASARDALVWIRREPGAFVVAGTAIALVHPPGACDDDFAHAVRHACVVGSDRTLWHDPEFAVKQLVEIALRALSPAANEPFTAITCIDRLTEGLAYVATAPAPRAAWPDEGGIHRVFAQPQPFETLLRASFDPIRIFAGPNPAVYARLLDCLAELAFVVRRANDHAQLETQAEVIRRASARTLGDDDDRAYVESRYQQTVEQLAGRATSKRR